MRTLATGEHMLMHVDMKAGRGSEMPGSMQAATTEIAKRQEGLPMPEAKGSAVGFRPKAGKE